MKEIVAELHTLSPAGQVAIIVTGGVVIIAVVWAAVWLYNKMIN